MKRRWRAICPFCQSRADYVEYEPEKFEIHAECEHADFSNMKTPSGAPVPRFTKMMVVEAVEISPV